MINSDRVRALYSNNNHHQFHYYNMYTIKLTASYNTPHTYPHKTELVARQIYGAIESVNNESINYKLF